jgi:hypothetical protein
MFSCKNKPAQETQFDYIEIAKSLNTTPTKLAYLQGMYDTDEKLREELPEIIQKYGYQSAEHKKAAQELESFTNQSIEKSIAYLKVWGFPDKQTLKSNAAEAPFVMLHNSDDSQIKREYFPYLWQGFKDRDIPGSAIAKFLNKLYKIESGENMIIQGAFTEKFELDTLLRSLKIEIE